MKKKRNSGQSRIDCWLRLVMIVCLIGSVTFAVYPYAAEKINELITQQRINYYQQALKKRQQKDQTGVQPKSDEQTAVDPPERIAVFNETLNKGISRERSYYNDRMIGWITMPTIDLTVPVLDQTNAALLEIGATLLEGTSYPSGGKSRHTVLTGHNGLPGKVLFTHLDETETGDPIYLEIEGKKMAYQITKKQVVLPSETAALAVKKDQDLLTLVTCTPYMVNTHRLLVQAKRIHYPKEARQMVNATHHRKLFSVWQASAGIGGLAVFLLGSWWWQKKKGKQRKQTKGASKS